jgi:hypothetical protein
MADYRYSAKIDHTEKTIELLYKTQYYAYSKLRILARLLIGLAMVVVALMVDIPTWGKGLLLLFGAWLLASKDFPAQTKADKALQERKAALPSMSYQFFGDRVLLSGEGSMNIPYKKFARLAEDKEYLYIFMSKDSVCMIDRATIKPQPDQDFMKFISDKTGLQWRREKSFLAMNFWDLRQMLKDRKEK